MMIVRQSFLAFKVTKTILNLPFPSMKAIAARKNPLPPSPIPLTFAILMVVWAVVANVETLVAACLKTWDRFGKRA
jgi:hypothetical protein